ncbi:hypothetical protein Elgi_59080 [Paenibacillus elgii]|nr:hypothetical protein Elgi_59080 [Paenibacillus elgii]
MKDRRMMRKHYALGVISELQRLGYSEEDAKSVFMRYYRGIKRSFGLDMNVNDFAKMIDEFHQAVNRKYDPNNPDHIYIGHIRDRFRKHKEKGGMVFRISKEMEQKIKDWDSCVVEDVAGAKFAYTFIPTGLGLVIEVKCDVCKRVLELSEW